MALTPGTRIGPYEIVESIGAGGMGEVYRATDTKLRRSVAIKVLHQAFARDEKRMERFAREARVLAALNHPNIAAIYGVEENALVMEFVEGDTLDQRIQRGAVPIAEALPIMRQIVEALDAAHSKDIIHRDLKPANVKTTPHGVVKVLDFGVAKIQERSGAPDMDSPTVEMDRTQEDVIVGTVRYMAPEQARGQEVDKRADIWSFGVLCYELITGKAPFAGRTGTDTLAAILTAEPDWESIPGKLRPLLQRCLAKDTRKRLRDIGDARFALEDLTEKAAAAPARRRGWLLWAIVAASIALVLLAVLYVKTRAREIPENALLQFSESPSPEVTVSGGRGVALSPDGKRLVYVALNPGGVRLLYTRWLEELRTAALGGTEGAANPFFSPDSQSVGFFASGKLKSIPAGGGPVVTWCDAPAGRGGAWMEDGSIVAALNNRGALSRISASGATPKLLTELKTENQENSHRWPQALPGGKAILFTAGLAGGGTYIHPHIEIQSLDNGARKTLRKEAVFARYVPSGHLIYVQEGSLFAAPMSVARLELTGPPALVLDDVFYGPGTGDALVSFSRTGTLAYVKGKEPQPLLAVYWMNSKGKLQSLISKPGNYSGPRLSPDGTRLADALTERDNTYIWVYDLTSGNRTRLTFDPGVEEAPVWTPGGERIAFRSDRGISWVRIDGAGGVETLTQSKNSQYPQCFTPDGKRLVYEELDPQTGLDIWTLPLDGPDRDHLKPGKAEVWLKTQFSEGAPALSPDGRWLAYRSNDSGKNEVYVRPFGLTGSAGKWQISEGDGDYPLWSRDGRQLFFRLADGHVMVTDYQTGGDTFIPGKPRLWSEHVPWAIGFTRGFDLTPDGQRLAVLESPPSTAEQKPTVQMNVLVNFFDEVRRRTRGPTSSRR